MADHALTSRALTNGAERFFAEFIPAPAGAQNDSLWEMWRRGGLDQFAFD